MRGCTPDFKPVCMKPATSSVKVAETIVREFNSTQTPDKASFLRTKIASEISTKVRESRERKTPAEATSKLIDELQGKANKITNNSDRQLFLTVLQEFRSPGLNPRAGNAAGAVNPPGFTPSVFQMPSVEQVSKNPTERLLDVTSECMAGPDDLRMRGQLVDALISFATDVLPGVSVPRNLSATSGLNQKIDMFLDHNARESRDFEMLATTMRQISDPDVPVADTAKVIETILSGDFTLAAPTEYRVPLSPGTGVEEVPLAALPNNPGVDVGKLFTKTHLAMGLVGGTPTENMARSLLMRHQQNLPNAVLIGLVMSKETSKQMDEVGLDGVLNNLKRVLTEQDQKLRQSVKNGPSKDAIFGAIELIRSTAVSEGRVMGPLNGAGR